MRIRSDGDRYAQNLVNVQNIKNLILKITERTPDIQREILLRRSSVVLDQARPSVIIVISYKFFYILFFLDPYV